MDDKQTLAFEEPKIADYGDLTKITAGSMNGDLTDKTFPVTTPKKDLTFS